MVAPEPTVDDETVTTCPSTERLEKLLDGALDDAGAVERHVDQCPKCQERLQQISDRVDAGPWLLHRSSSPAASLAHRLDQRMLDRHKRQIMATLQQQSAPQQTTTTSRFTLLDRHDSGGLSTVYIFFEEALQRKVALKALRGDRSIPPELRRRFIREYQITSSLDHPGVAPVYGVGQFDDGRDFFTMRFVGGDTLANRIAAFHEGGAAKLRRDCREFRELLASLRTVCETIDYAHRHRVVHRDLKPKNIQVDGRETIVLDWGLAKRLDDDETSSTVTSNPPTQGETRFDERLGTPAYMSPEQAAGGGTHVDDRSDVYGLGAMLFETLTGRPPHELPQTIEEGGEREAAEELYRRIREDESPRAGRVAAHLVPAELDSVCARAMAHDPQDRYRTAAQLADELDHWLRREPVQAHRYSPWQRAGLWIDRHRSWAAALMAALVLIACVSSIAAFLVFAARHEAEQTAELARRHRVYAGANLAAEMLAAEIDLRWRILEAEAADDELHMLLGRLETLPADTERQALLNRIRDWSTARYHEHSDATRATSWFVMDRRGTLLARNPENEPSRRAVGKNFRYRDYFHGQGRNLDRLQAGDVDPITKVHRSAVFVSTITNSYMVAFSVPVWSVQEGTPLGVLGMTIEMARFDSLQRAPGEDQVLVLVDSNTNWIDDEPRRGLLLHHPHLVQMRKRIPATPLNELLFFLGDQRCETLDQLRETKLAEERRLRDLPWEQQLDRGRQPSADSLDVAYHDPIGPPYSGDWVAAFAPVIIKGREMPIKDTGLVVIVQERQE